MTASRITLSPCLNRGRVTAQREKRMMMMEMVECEDENHRETKQDSHHNSSRNEERRRVQFAVTSSSNLSNTTIETQFIEPTYELTNQLCNELWWSLEEQAEHGIERHFLAAEFRDSEKGEMVEEGFQVLYKDCSTMSISQVMRTKAAKSVLFEVVGANNNNNDDDDDDTNCCLRGLESRLSKTVSRRRKHHVHAMLSIIDKVGTGTSTSMDILSANSQQSSRASQVLARAIALVDAKEASS